MGAYDTIRSRVEESTHGIEGSQLRLVSTDGQWWQPYVGVMAKALIETVLRDHYNGGPREGFDANDLLWAAVIADDEPSNPTYVKLYGAVRGVEDNELVFVDGTRVNLDDVVSIEI